MCALKLDGVVVVLDANASVEPQTEALRAQADEYNLRGLVVCNKVDELGAHSLVERLSAKLLLLRPPAARGNEGWFFFFE